MQFAVLLLLGVPFVASRLAFWKNFGPSMHDDDGEDLMSLICGRNHCMYSFPLVKERETDLLTDI